MYRFAVWLKKTNSTDGLSYLGLSASGANVTYLNGTSEANPYFWYGDLPELDKWFLVVGFVHGKADPSTTTYGGIYDGITGEKYSILQDFKFGSSTTTVRNRSYSYYNGNTNDRQYYYAPRIDEVNGNEPSITELLAIQPGGLSHTNQEGISTSVITGLSAAGNQAKRYKIASVSFNSVHWNRSGSMVVELFSKYYATG